MDLNNGGSGSSSSSSSGGGGVVVEAITWEQNKGGIRLSEEQAKKEVLLITRTCFSVIMMRFQICSIILVLG